MRGGAALLLAGSGLAALATDAGATPPNSSIGALPAGDLAYARLLIGFELLTIDYYGNVVRSGHLHGSAQTAARRALANEQAHYDYLARVLVASGQTPLTAADIDFSYPSGAFYTADALDDLGALLESFALGSYLGAGGNIATPALQSSLAQIAANEAQHLSVFFRRNGAPAFQDAFPEAMTIAEASDALDRFTS